jgi:hypothetical protein
LGSVYRLASGAEFSSQSFGLWAHGKGVKLDFNLASAPSSGIRAGLQWSQASEDFGLNPHFGDLPPGILVHAKDSVRRSVTFSAGSEKIVAVQALGCRGSEELFFSISRVELKAVVPTESSLRDGRFTAIHVMASPLMLYLKRARTLPGPTTFLGPLLNLGTRRPAPLQRLGLPV